MINAGIIGLGPVWDSRYRPALESLSARVRITAVYDPVEERAQAAARALSAQHIPGILTLSRRPDLDACLILGKDWTNLPALKFICEARKPAYIAGSLGYEIPAIGEIHLLSLSEGLTFMPEFSRRYTPATFRLRELSATRLGAPQRIVCEARLPQASRRDLIPGQAEQEDFLIGLFDWCLHILPGRPVDVLRSPLPHETHKGCEVQVRFQSRQGESAATLRVYETEQSESAGGHLPAPGEVRFDVHCEQGVARLGTSSEIAWSLDDERQTESLAADRTDVEVMLDHFFRRVVGGLIPVADLADICRAINVFRAMECSTIAGEPVPVPGQF